MDETKTEEAHIAAHRFLVIGEDPGRINLLVDPASGCGCRLSVVSHLGGVARTG
jgi:hypothetical protein